MHKWFYSQEGATSGPVSSKVLAELVLKGRMDIDDVIVSEQDNTRCMVREVPEIMEIIHKPLPRAIVADIDAAKFGDFKTAGQPLEDLKPLFYNLPVRTLLIAQLLTCGLFEWYWFLMQWNYLRFQTKDDRSSSLLDSVIHILFTYNIFHEIETNLDMIRVKRSAWNAGTLALLWYLVFPLMLFNPLQRMGIISGIFSYLLVFMLTTFLLLPVQSYINEVNEALKRPLSKPGLDFYMVVLSSVIALALVIYLLYR